MDIRNVRARFQHKVDFFIANYASENKFQMLYSLQQDSTKMRYIHLYITSNTDPKLEGKHINIKNQDYLVYKTINEPFSFNEWTYRLLILSEKIELRQVMAEDNVIGGSKIVLTDGDNFKIDGDDLKVINGTYLAFLQDRISSEEGVQPMVSSELHFLLPLSEPIDPSKNYDILYKGVRHKLKNISISFGAWLLKVTREI